MNWTRICRSVFSEKMYLNNMTKVEAIVKLMEDNGGVASLKYIYDNIIKYYPSAKQSDEWEAGLRGVLYRELKKQRLFKKVGLSIYALADYVPAAPPKNDNMRMHSYIEGICLELGNFLDFNTYTADPSAVYRDNIHLNDIASMQFLPEFSYKEIMHEVKRIDVIWFNKEGLSFPKRVFEVVDSVGTLTGAFNRSLQLQNFMTEFNIVAPEKHHDKYLQTIELEIYQTQKGRFNFINYDDIIEWYDSTFRKNKVETKIFG